MENNTKTYLCVGTCRNLEIEIYDYNTNEMLYSGSVDDAPEKIRNLKWVKVELGKVTKFYVKNR